MFPALLAPRYKATGVRTKHMKSDILYRLACFWNDRDTDDVTGGRNIQTFMDWAQGEVRVVTVEIMLSVCSRWRGL